MKTIFLFVGLLMLTQTTKAQYYSIEKTVNPVFLCNSSVITSVTWEIKCEGPCKVFIQKANDRGVYYNIKTQKSDAYGYAKYKSTGLKLNTTFDYRFFVQPINGKIPAISLSDNKFRYKSVYTTKKCD